MDLLDFFITSEETDFDSIRQYLISKAGPSPWDDIVSFTSDVYETAGDIFEFGYLSARVAFAAPFVFGAAALFSITDQLLALIDPDYIY